MFDRPLPPKPKIHTGWPPDHLRHRRPAPPDADTTPEPAGESSPDEGASDEDATDDER
jgi:hypothetical protein